MRSFWSSVTLSIFFLQRRFSISISLLYLVYPSIQDDVVQREESRQVDRRLHEYTSPSSWSSRPSPIPLDPRKVFSAREGQSDGEACLFRDLISPATALSLCASRCLSIEGCSPEKEEASLSLFVFSPPLSFCRSGDFEDLSKKTKQKRLSVVLFLSVSVGCVRTQESDALRTLDVLADVRKKKGKEKPEDGKKKRKRQTRHREGGREAGTPEPLTVPTGRRFPPVCPYTSRSVQCMQISRVAL